MTIDTMTTGAAADAWFRTSREADWYSRPNDAARWDELKRWLRQVRTSGSLEHDDLVTPPSLAVVERAVDLLEEFRRTDPTAPDVVSIGPNGEVLIEWRSGAGADQFIVWDDLRIDRMQYRAGRLVTRETLEPAMTP